MQRAIFQLAIVAVFLALPLGAAAPHTQPDQESSSKRPADQQQPAREPSGPDNAAGDTASAAADIDVGTFYLHKGDVDAAIDRYKDAIQAQPNWGKPRLLLAEAYEKKHDPSEAVKYYKEYLKVFPHAPDAKKIQAKIDKLSGR